MTREERDRLLKEIDGGKYLPSVVLYQIVCALPVADPAPVGETVPAHTCFLVNDRPCGVCGKTMADHDKPHAPTELEAAVGELLAVVDSNISTHPQFLGTIARVRAAMGRKDKP